MIIGGGSFLLTIRITIESIPDVPTSTISSTDEVERSTVVQIEDKA